MILRFLSAGLRSALVATWVALPALILPAQFGEDLSLVGLVAALAALFTFAEYAAQSPAVLAFRYAPPFNRMRFAIGFVVVLLMSLALRGVTHAGLLSELALTLGLVCGHLLDIPFSPVRLMILAVPSEAGSTTPELVRVLAGIGAASALVWTAGLAVHLRGRAWPLTEGPFNVLVNLPQFDPTTGRDVVERLRHLAGVNFLLAFLLPFVIPAVLYASPLGAALLDSGSPVTLVWGIAAWTLIPCHLAARGIALLRIAELVTEVRLRRAPFQPKAQPAPY